MTVAGLTDPIRVWLAMLHKLAESSCPDSPSTTIAWLALLATLAIWVHSQPEQDQLQDIADRLKGQAALGWPRAGDRDTVHPQRPFPP